MKALTHTDFNFPGQKSVYHGKVRDVYNINDELMVMVATDRISAFDVILPKGIPFKGQVLNQIAATFLDATSDIVPNWKLATPDPMVTVGLKCEGFRVEMIIRGYLTGSAWREYQNGCRELCGVKLPEGMKENQKFPTPIITPTTKADAGHDENISKEEIIAQGLVSKEDYELRKELEKEQKKSAGKDTPQGKNKDKKKKYDKKDSNADEKDDQPKDIVVELKGIEDRVVRLTPNSSDMGSTIISKDGETLYYLAAFEGGYDLWKMNLRKKETKLLHKMDAGWADMQLDKDGKNLFLLGSRKMQKMDTSSDALTPITFQVDAKMDLAAEREYMFDHVYRQQQKRFYNTNMHGVDWDKMTAAYRRFLPHIDNNYDFAELLSEWLGELNVSHTGGRFYPKGQSEPTASLGLFFDWNYTGKGMLIAEVVEKGPFDTANTRVKAGTVIEKIDGVEITPDADYYTLLNNKARKKTLVSLFDPQTKEHWEEVIIPITNGAFSDLLYSRWVKQRAADGLRAHRVYGRRQFPFRLLGHPGKIQQPRRHRHRHPFQWRWTLARGYRNTFQWTKILHPSGARSRDVRHAQPPLEQTLHHGDVRGQLLQCARHAVGLQPPRTGQAGRHARAGNHDQRVVGTPARPVIGIRHPRRGLPPVGRQLSGELAAGAGHQSSQFTRDHREGRRHTAESCRRGTAEGTRKISTALPHAGIPVI